MESIPVADLWWVLLPALLFLAGLVDSIAGGGGLISLPAYLAAGLPPHAALATNKFSSSVGTAAAVARFARAGTVRWAEAAPAALGAVVGAAAGSRLALLCPAAAIETAVLLLVPAVALLLLLRDRLPGSGAPAGTRPRIGSAGLIGLGIGAYDGFFGPGTGTLMAIAFHLILGHGLLTAAACARTANLASNLGALAVFLAAGRVIFPLALATAAANAAGNLVGSRLALGQGARLIRPVTLVVLGLLLAEVVRRRLLG